MSTYSWLTPIQHILTRPDTHVGAVAVTEVSMHTFEMTGAQPVRRDLTVQTSPALLKVNDEVLVNAIDNHHRDGTQKYIKQTFASDGVFSVSNDGSTIPIELWPGTDRYKIEILFGEPMSGENFDDTKKRVGGGRNGVGVKIANILSEWFEVDIVNLGENVIFRTVHDEKGKLLSRLSSEEDATPVVKVGKLGFSNVDEDGGCNETTLIHMNGRIYRNVGPLRYQQRFESNLSKTHPPTVTKPLASVKSSSTTVRWKVDLTRLGMTAPLSEDVMSVLKTRAFDTAACTANKISVSVNGDKVPFKGLKEYAAALGGAWVGRDTVSKDGSCLDVCISSVEDRAEACCIGFVNGLRCCAGSHLKIVFDQLTEVVSNVLSRRLKRPIKLTHNQLRDQLIVVVSAQIVNPTFTSQTKEKLDTRLDKLGLVYVCSSAMAKGLDRQGVVEQIAAALTVQEDRAVSRSVKTDRGRISSIPKYEKALKLSSKKPCCLYVTEGDSAKALAVAGFSVIGRDYNGVFPLRGKLVNVSGMSAKTALQHKEIMHLTQILGLEPHKEYTTEMALALPYRHLVIFTDQDHDGSHIMGLIMNWLQTFYAGLLLALPDFVHRFATHVIRAKVGKDYGSFYSQVEYESWLKGRKPTTVKYFKGLGTSTTEDAKRYFENIDAHRIVVRHTGDSSQQAVRTFFNADMSNERKRVLLVTDQGAFVDYAQPETTFEDFCYRELAHFGIADNIRSICMLTDGLKPSQRKVIFAAFKRLSSEVKVAQFAAYTAELTAYHHGEKSLVETIVGMAQPWMGANNIALLKPKGMFGSRNMPRSDHAAERYLFTERHEIARLVFPPTDDSILEMAHDDGCEVEPRWYCPIIPFLLVNGAEGIGTGWKSSCPAFSPVEVIRNTRLLANDPTAALNSMTPYYLGFAGTVTNMEDGVWQFTGSYSIESDTTIRITELPPKRWTGPYIEWIRETLIGDAAKCFVTDIVESSSNDFVNILLKTRPNADIRQRDLVKDLKLSTRVDVNFLNFFTPDASLTKCPTVYDVLRRHAECRRLMYRRRLDRQIEQTRHAQRLAENRARFLREVKSGALVPGQMTDVDLRAELVASGYYEFENFQYLETVSLFAMTRDTTAKLETDARKHRELVQALLSTTVEQVWNEELDALERAVLKYEADILEKRRELSRPQKRKADCQVQKKNKK